MFGTRSRFPTAQVIDRQDGGTELLIVAHGERSGHGDNQCLIELAGSLDRLGRFAAVRPAVLNGEPSLESALAVSRARGLLVYPLFMGDGYCVREALPRRLRAHGHRFRIFRPFGLEPTLRHVIAAHAGRALKLRGARPAERALLLVGHGSSKSDDSRRATEWQAARVRGLARFADVRTAYLENAPFLPDALAALPAEPMVIVGFFCGVGRHAAVDVPSAILASRREDLVYAGSLGAAPEAAQLIAQTLVPAG